jgi:flagellar biosynthesis regulator FlbT
MEVICTKVAKSDEVVAVWHLHSALALSRPLYENEMKRLSCSTEASSYELCR